jgi:hypothetical protein
MKPKVTYHANAAYIRLSKTDVFESEEGTPGVLFSGGRRLLKTLVLGRASIVFHSVRQQKFATKRAGVNMRFDTRQSITV